MQALNFLYISQIPDQTVLELNSLTDVNPTHGMNPWYSTMQEVNLLFGQSCLFIQVEEELPYIPAKDYDPFNPIE